MCPLWQSHAASQLPHVLRPQDTVLQAQQADDPADEHRGSFQAGSTLLGGGDHPPDTFLSTPGFSKVLSRLVATALPAVYCSLMCALSASYVDSDTCEQALSAAHHLSLHYRAWRS